MSIIASSFANLASGLIIQYLPVGNNTLSLQASMFTKDAIMFAFDKGKNIGLLSYIFKSKPHIIISSTVEGSSKVNPIYQKMEQYIVTKYIKELVSCQVIPKRGDIEVSMSHLKGTLKDIQDTYMGIKYNIKHVYSSEEITTQNGKATVKSNSFVIESINGSFDDIKKYIKYVFELNKLEVKVMRVYQPRVYKSKDHESISWESLYVKSNKHIGNTVLNGTLNDDLVVDVERFLKNQEWYDTRGVPYKRGYILYGPPGTGKTSVIKAIANTHNLPVFTIDFDIISSNNKLSELITEINYHHKNSPYILCMEDVDRSKMFSRYSDSVSPECLLNVLDGVVEAYGRIVFMTVNDISKIKNSYVRDMEFSKALIRPGRIDKVLEIGFLDKPQAEKMIQIFYETDITIDFDPKGCEISPAELVQIMQLYPDDLTKMVDAFKARVGGKGPTGPILGETMNSGVSSGRDYRGRRRRVRVGDRYKKNPLDKLRSQIKYDKRRVKNRKSLYNDVDKLEEKIKKKEERLQKMLDREKAKKQREKAKAKKEKEKLQKQKARELKKQGKTTGVRSKTTAGKAKSVNDKMNFDMNVLLKQMEKDIDKQKKERELRYLNRMKID